MSEFVLSFGKNGVTFFVNSKPEKGRANKLFITMLLKSRSGAFQKKIRLKKIDFERIQDAETNEEKIIIARELFYEYDRRMAA